MAMPIAASNSRVNAISPAGVSQSYANSTYSSYSKSTIDATFTAKNDTITVSNSAQALSLYQQGRTVEQIAIQLGIHVDTVKQYLGLQTESMAAEAMQSIDNLNNLLELANSRPSAESLKSYLGYNSKGSTENTNKVYSGLA